MPLSPLIPTAASIAKKYAKSKLGQPQQNRNTFGTPSQSKNNTKIDDSILGKAKNTYNQVTSNPAVKSTLNAIGNYAGMANPTLKAAIDAASIYKNIATKNKQNSSPSSVNTAAPSQPQQNRGTFGVPNQNQTAQAQPIATQPYTDPATAYLANEQALISSGNKQSAVQNSQTYTAPSSPTTPAALTATPSNQIPTPASAGAAKSANLANLARQNLERLQKQYAATLTPTQREQELQKQLTELQGATALGVSGLEGQGRGISEGLIRGQQAQLQEQGNLKAQTLSDLIANETANREAQAQVYGSQLEAAQAEQARQDALTAPTQVGNQILQFDPATGQYKTLYSAPESANLPASAQEYEYARQNGYTGSFMDYQAAQGGGGGSGGFTLGNTRYDAQGNIIAQAPSETELKNQQADITAQQNAEDALAKVIALQGMPGIHQAVGLTGSIANIPGTTGANYRAQVESLKAALTLPALQAMKGMGALSDADVRLLNNSVAALNTNMSVKAFEAELERIKTTLQSKSGSAQNTGVIDPNVWSEEAKQAYIDQGGDPTVFSNDLSMSRNGSTWGNLGSLSEKYESGGNPGAIGYDSTGGYSYGTYQLAHSNAQKFVEQSPFKTAFAGLKFNSKEWQNKWKEVAQKAPQQFAQAQKEYIAKTHFEPQVEKLKKLGINVAALPQVIQDAIWSTAVQHGANTDVVTKAFAHLSKNASPADMLKAIYKERWSGGARFASSTPAVKKSVYNRFFGKNGELALALQRLQTSSIG